MAKMMTVQLISTYDEFFDRSKSGAIWGRVYFQIGNSEFFPERGWTDLVAAFLRSWLRVIIGVCNGNVTRETVHFLDGPLEVGVATAGAHVVELSFLHRGARKLFALAEVKDLLKNALLVTEELLERCRERNWTNLDTEALAELTKQGTLALERDD